MKKQLDAKKLTLETRTVAVLADAALHRAAGAMRDPTLGVCGTSRNTYCPSQKPCL